MFNRKVIRELLEEHNLTLVFNELGWNYENEDEYLDFDYKGEKYNVELKQIADKTGYAVYTLDSEDNDSRIFNNKALRDQIQNKVKDLKRENLIIYTDREKNIQIWQTALREKNQPIRRKEIKYIPNKTEEEILRALENLYFNFDEEDSLNIMGVTGIVKRTFDVEKITKKFYDSFKKEHSKFFELVEGIESIEHTEWYTSVMLNRLMFIYFIQKKGFLNNDKDYLRTKLKVIKDNEGENEFYGFYLDFLKVLFNDGLNKPENLRNSETNSLLGDIPYLNGGMFAEHFIEDTYKELKIPDKAFEVVFDFFDKYQWTLDEREDKNENNINPDVIGYIFEKYINQKQMGAYYTKEDITDYISSNTIVPFIFEKAKEIYPEGFNESSFIWYMLKENPDRYIYNSVKKGINREKDIFELLPEEIAEGLNDVSKRTNWNTKTPEKFALPTEIWRETIERYTRYFEIKNKIQNGEIKSINDFITYNLDIKQFLQDIIENSDDGKLIRAIYYTIAGRKPSKSNENEIMPMSILDPTCGSGAFLFAALNILEPLYEACIDKMEEFAAEGVYRDFKEVLEDIDSHINKKYFIYKSIILNNLYGVDIMHEAIEIAKLRLFLKLVSLVENKEDIEPLPDIDFNIKCGNTLVGFATKEEIKKISEGKMFDEITPIIEEESKIVSLAFNQFKRLQNTVTSNAIDLKRSKEFLNDKLNNLNHKLDKLLGENYYQVESSDKGTPDERKFSEWKNSHQPFHWFAEFYEVIEQNKGFDVIIGNPPYVEYSKVSKEYKIKNFKTEKCGNLYGYTIERSLTIQKSESFMGMIIPISAFCTDRMDIFQKRITIDTSYNWISNYAERPSKLFDGAERNLSIIISRLSKSESKPVNYTTKYNKWNSEFREHLFNTLSFVDNSLSSFGIIPKFGVDLEKSIYSKLLKMNYTLENYIAKKTEHILYYRNSGGRYWKIITDFQPEFYLNNEKTASSRESYLYFNSKEHLSIAISLLNSSLYYWFYIMNSDARTNNPSDLKSFPIDFNLINSDSKKLITSLSKKLMKNMIDNSKMKNAKYSTGEVKFQQYYPQFSKNIIDDIDFALADIYGLSLSELEFIKNFDAKYRILYESEDEE